MFGIFKTDDFLHPSLGAFKWVRGCWRGETTLPGGKVAPLIVVGSRKGPNLEALEHAVDLHGNLQSIEPQLRQAMFDHFEPYAGALRDEDLKVKDSHFPSINNAAQALAFAEVEAIVVLELDGALATEVCYRVPWDEEHILGARFRGKNWIELCGSTLVP